MSRALEHSPIRHSKTVPLLGIVAAVRYGKGKPIVSVALFGTTSGRVLRFWFTMVNSTLECDRQVQPRFSPCWRLRCAALHLTLSRALTSLMPSPKYPVLNKEGLQESFPMAGICGRC